MSLPLDPIHSCINRFVSLFKEIMKRIYATSFPIPGSCLIKILKESGDYGEMSIGLALSRDNLLLSPGSETPKGRNIWDLEF